MTSLRPFQIIIIAVFAVLAIVAVFLLMNFQGQQQAEEQRFGRGIVIWGSLPSDTMKAVLGELGKQDKAFESVSYRRVNASSFDETFVNAIAEGRGPDVVLLSNTDIVKHRSKLLAISYESIDLRQFRDDYIDGAEIFAFQDGVYALPLGVDPLVMYWNRDLFATGGLAQPPTTWEFMVESVVPSLVVRDNQRNILQAALAFGEVRNVRNAKEVLLLLALQSGSQLIYEDERGRYQIDLDQSRGGLPPLEAAVSFFTRFSNPNNTLYSWNRIEPVDRNAFTAGDLAMYFGFGSELAAIQAQNPNLNFDVAAVPQGASATIKRTFGNFYGFAIPRSAPNTAGAFEVMGRLTSPAVASALNDGYNLAPVRRTELARQPEGVFQQVINTSALTARSWLDPDNAATDDIFLTLVEDTVAGRDDLSSLIDDAVDRIKLAF